MPRGEVRELVETIRLESGHTLTGIGGSNPSLSAIPSLVFTTVERLASNSPTQVPGARFIVRSVNLDSRIANST